MTNINGRINILQTNVSSNGFLNQKIEPRQSSNYTEALRGNIECSPLSDAFFSKENIQMIQNAIRSTVYNRSNKQYVIAQQDVTNLKIIMRGIYLQYSRNMTNNIPQQINNINNLVVQHCVPKILSEAKAYLKYKLDASTLVSPLDNPFHSSYKNKTNEFKRFF